MAVMTAMHVVSPPHPAQKEPGATIAGLFPDRHSRSLAAGDFLFRQDDAADRVFLIRQGRLQMLRHLASGTAVVTHTGKAGELFAEAALFSDTYRCDAQAADSVVVASCTKQQLRAALAASPVLALEWMETVTRQLHAARVLLELRSIRSAKTRVLHHLRLRADAAGHVELGGRLLDTAAELGLTHEAYYRGLSARRRAGVIRSAPGQICLLDHGGETAREGSCRCI